MTRPPPTPEPLDPTLREGVAGMWHYHLSRGGAALCGEPRTMPTHAPRATWGFKPTHMLTSYCRRCDELMRETT